MTQTPTEDWSMFVKMQNILGFPHSRQYEVSNTASTEPVNKLQSNIERNDF